MLAGIHALHQLNGLILPVVSFFYIYQDLIFSIVPKRLAPSCSSITIVDSQTFHQMSVFDGKTHNLQTRKYDVNMTSLVEYLILL